MSAPDRRARLDMRNEKLSAWQCALLGVARSGVYRLPKPARADDAAVMRRIDALHTDHPFYGSRRIAFELDMSRKRVWRLRNRKGKSGRASNIPVPVVLTAGSTSLPYRRL